MTIMTLYLVEKIVPKRFMNKRFSIIIDCEMAWVRCTLLQKHMTNILRDILDSLHILHSWAGCQLWLSYGWVIQIIMTTITKVLEPVTGTMASNVITAMETSHGSGSSVDDALLDHVAGKPPSHVNVSRRRVWHNNGKRHRSISCDINWTGYINFAFLWYRRSCDIDWLRRPPSELLWPAASASIVSVYVPVASSCLLWVSS